jgi:hypothetical protein
MSDQIDSIKLATGTIPGELITKKELAQRLRISTRKIELDPHWPSVRFGRTVRYDWGEVMAYLKGKSAVID